MRAIRSGRPRSGGVLARNFIDHRSRYLPALQRAPRVSMVKGTQEGAIPFGRPFRRIARRSGEQTQDRRRVLEVGVDIDVDQSHHGNVVTDLSEVDALKSRRVDNDERLREVLHRGQGDTRRSGIAIDQCSGQGTTGTASVMQSAKGVFLRYASEDAGVAKSICDALRRALS